MGARKSNETPADQYTNARTWAKHGGEGLHDHLSTRMERAMGKQLPQLEVRFSNLTLSAEAAIPFDQELGSVTADRIPTLTNELKRVVLHSLPGSKRTMTKQILNNVSGVFKPGTMTLLLGHPGSGKSSLMKLLSGRFLMTRDITCSGEITYNGTKLAAIAKRLPQLVSYVAQDDNHIPTLTVKETLEFAHECSGTKFSGFNDTNFTEGTSEENNAALDAVRAMHMHYPEIITRQLGLKMCQNTIVGDGVAQGISGGHRRRVTTGEMEVGSKFVTLMDEISTDLDSAATYGIVKTQRSVAKTWRNTVVIAMQHPSPEVFALFDNVMVLNQGSMVYNGPRDAIVGYFEDMGFRCPPSRSMAEFLLDLGTDQQYNYVIAKHGNFRCPRQSLQFAQYFQQSAVHDSILEVLESPHDPARLHDALHHFAHIPEFHQSFGASTWTLLKREVKIVGRKRAFLLGRAGVIMLQGLIYSLLFYQFDPKDAQVVFGTIFAAVMVVALGQNTLLPLYFASRENFYKQRAANFYRTSSFVLASSMSRMPLALVEIVLFGTLIYWMCGFAADLEGFLTFELVLFAVSLAFNAWFFFLSALLPNLHVAKSLGLISLVICVLFSGFIITPHEIPVYFMWAYWINPVTWGFRSLAINQYRREEFDKCVYDGIDYCAQYASNVDTFSLGTFQGNTERNWILYGVLFLFAFYIGFMVLAVYALESIRYDSHEHQFIAENNADAIVMMASQDSEDAYKSACTPREDSAGMVMIEVQSSLRDRDFIAVTLAFQNVWYTVPCSSNLSGTRDILKGVSGFALPGTMTALMGSSGAGKSALMDIIAGRKRKGIIRGEVFLNGHPATELAIQRATGYCEQTDIHSEAATIREALMFSAFLRMGSEASDGKKIDSVEDCLDLLDLRPIADQIIRGSSVEQMKRLSIGVELAAQPSVLFLDEPTSGLDARSAKIIMEGVRKVAYTGRTVVCTIHQPSQEVFGLFDSLLLLKRGGETVYFGDLGNGGSELVKYFESIPGTPRFVTGYNPATWMLEAIGAGGDCEVNATTDFVDAFEASDKAKHRDQRLARVVIPEPGVGCLEFISKQTSSSSTQAKCVIMRFVKSYWRAPSYNLTRLVVNIFLALLFGLSFASTNYDTYQGVNAGMGMVFAVVIFLSLAALKGVAPIMMEDRAAFYRERGSESYNSFWYLVGATVVEIPYVIMTTLVFSTIFSPIIGLTGAHRFVLFWLNLSLQVLLNVYLGQLLVFVLPSLEGVAVVRVMITSLYVLFTGFIPPASAIPVGYHWLFRVLPPTYTIAAIGAILYSDCPESGDDAIGCKLLSDVPPPHSANMTVKDYVEDVFWAKHDDIGTNALITICLILLLRVLALLVLRFICYRKT